MNIRLRSPRAYAIYILYEILIKNHSRDKIISEILKGDKTITDQDLSLVFNIVMNTLRYKDVFDEIISRISNSPLERLEKKILIAIEVALSQILCMNRIPVYAAVSETINGFKEIEESQRKTGFLNHLLRKILIHKELKELFLRYKQDNLTSEIFSKVLKGEADIYEIKQIYRSSYKRSPTTIRINPMKSNRDEILQRLSESGIKVKRSNIAQDCIIIEEDISIPYLKKILPHNIFTIQSELSQLAVDILSPKKGEKILDVCSGSQIKSSHIYERMEGDVEITSIDIKDIKASLFKFIKGDASRIRLDDRYDKILIDAPCSGLGTLSSNPEIKYRLDRASIRRYARIQAGILNNIAKNLKSGGRLLYAVCTITDSETRKVIKNFVEENPQFEIIRPALDLMEYNRFFTRENFLRIVDFNSNSFFYALLQRK